jgi:8-oxo-dGTP pyrophosphatase MutT (NUDIX family)
VNWPDTTWDGLPVSAEPPHGVSVVVWRRSKNGVEWLLLHRAHHGPEYSGDWAWGPPAGARLPDEPIEECVRRELEEEVGHVFAARPTRCGAEDWPVYEAEAPPDLEVALSAEHDGCRWLPLEDAQALCLPAYVGDSLACVAALVG